jgi:hypothetical protein
MTKTIALLVVLAAVEARAQWIPSICSGSSCDVIGGVLVTGAVFDAALGIGGLVTGTGSSVKIGQGHFSKVWHFLSLGMGGGNLLACGLWSYIAANNFGKPGYVALAAAHGAIGAWNLVSALVGFNLPPEVAPVVIGGRDAAGRRWTGVGVRVLSF